MSCCCNYYDVGVSQEWDGVGELKKLFRLSFNMLLMQRYGHSQVAYGALLMLRPRLPQVLSDMHLMMRGGLSQVTSDTS